MSNFRKIDNFSHLHAYISKTIIRSSLKASQACFQFNSDQVGHSVPEVNSVTLMAKIACGQTAYQLKLHINCISTALIQF